MKIDSYSFGSIQIDGKDYSTDVILLGGDVKSPWWREAGGHVYAVEDFEDVPAGTIASPIWTSDKTYVIDGEVIVSGPMQIMPGTIIRLQP